jgi:2-dehydropantoate 2-reductase
VRSKEDTLTNQKVGVIGLGPVGTILAAYLAKGGATVYGAEANQERADQVNRDGLRVIGYAELNERAESCFTRIAELAEVKGLDAVFLCTKTWALRGVMEEFDRHRWPENMRIAAFMNGIGPEDTVGEYVPKDRIFRGVVNYGCNLTEDGAANMNWFHPPMLLGPAIDRETAWAGTMEDILSEAGLTTVRVTHYEMKKEAFFKTILNSALNALCAAHGLTMSEAMRLKHTRHFARMLLREGLIVAGLVGYTYGEDALDRCISYLESGGEHYPSMWFDLKNRRPTEIEFINGKIVKIGRMFRGVPVDLNLFFTSAIVTQEIRNGTRDEDDIPDFLFDS